MSASSGGGHSAPAQRVVAERRWRLGVHSRGHPHRIIGDLLGALLAHNVAYKKTAPYNYKCRKVYPALAEVRLDALARENHNGVQSDHGSSSSLPGSTERVLKFELQMYKMREGEYCVDIQRLTGELFLFMDLCGGLLSSLHI